MRLSETDSVTLNGVRAHGYHGVLPAERETGQEFVVDVTLFFDTAPAAAADDLAKTVDYGDLAVRLTEVIAGEPVNLIETLAERLAGVCLAGERVEAAQVTVRKPSAPIPVPFEDVRVTITRSRR
jgi:dihydroneopterin aldolase